MEEMHTLMDWRFSGGAIDTELNLAHRPGLMRIYFTNSSLPFPLDGYTTPINIKPANLLEIPYNPNWLEVLRSQVHMLVPSGGITVSNFSRLVSDNDSNSNAIRVLFKRSRFDKLIPPERPTIRQAVV
jgi:hypothetical protein